jgi:glycosyltransferase involved in cell wall biosynthesis
VDVIHAHWWFPSGLVAAAVAGLLQKPLVITCHGSDVFLLSELHWLRPLARAVMNSADHVTVVSNRLRQGLLDQLDLSTSLSVIAEPLDLSRADRVPATAQSKEYILFVGRLTEQKGVHVLIDAFAQMKGQDEVNLIIVGDGPLRGELEQRVEVSDNASRVSFTGHLPNPEAMRLVRHSSVLVMPSVTGHHGEVEGLGVVLLEALSMGIPVIGTDTGGIPDIVQDGLTGRLVPEKDPAELARAMAWVLENPALARRLAQAGQERVRAQFSADSVAGLMAQVYRSVVYV